MDYQEAIEVLTGESGCVDLDTANRGCIEESEQKFMDACNVAISAMQELQIYKENEKMNITRADRFMDECGYRHENGNCLKAGGFCTSVPLSHCQKYKDFHAEYLEYRKLGNLEEVRKAVEKQHPEEPMRDCVYKHQTRWCAKCKRIVIRRWKHCPICGQKLDWSEKDD